MLHKAFGTPKKQKNNKKLKKHFLGKIFNFDLKKQLQLVKDLEVIAIAFAFSLFVKPKNNNSYIPCLQALPPPFFCKSLFPQSIDALFDKKITISLLIWFSQFFKFD